MSSYLRQLFRLVTPALALTLAAPALKGQAVFADNLGQTSIATVQTLNNFTGTQFTTDASAASFVLTNVTLKITAVLATGGTFVVKIYSNSAGKPSVSLGTLSGSTPTTSGNFAYTTGGINLSASTPYWVVIEGTGVGQYQQSATSSPTVTGGWSISSGSAFSSDSGVSWVNSDAFGYRTQVSLSATAVPEPSTYAVLAGALSLGYVAWRRRRAITSGRAGPASRS